MIVSPRKIAFGCIFLLSKKIRQNFSGFFSSSIFSFCCFVLKVFNKLLQL